jgi:hypothetical protein
VPDYMIAYTGKYLASADIGDKTPTVKIARVVIELVENDKKKGPDGKALLEKKWIVYFERAEKGMLLNRTNAELLVALVQQVAGIPRKQAGLTESWPGHQVTLAARDVQLGPDTVKGLRIVGSPELTQPLEVTVKLKKKAAKVHTLHPTGRGAAPPPAAAPPADEPPPPPERERVAGEDDE